MLLSRPRVDLPFSLTPVASVVAAAIAGERLELIEPLMQGLDSDLLPRDDRAQELFGVRLHRFDAAVEHALREWERERGAGGAMSEVVAEIQIDAPPQPRLGRSRSIPSASVTG